MAVWQWEWKTGGMQEGKDRKVTKIEGENLGSHGYICGLDGSNDFVHVYPKCPKRLRILAWRIRADDALP